MTSKASLDYSTIDKVSMFRLFECIGIPTRVAVPIVKQITQWESTSGPEWTVARLKSLKTLYLQHYGGNKTFRLGHAAGILCSNDGRPKGPFKALWTMGYSYKTVNKVLVVLQSYTSYLYLGEPLPKQLDKFCQAVTCPKPAGNLPEWKLTKEILWLFNQAWEKSQFDSVESWTRSMKHVIHMDQTDGIIRVPENSITVASHVADLLQFVGPWFDEYSVRCLLVGAGVNQVKFWKWTVSDIIENEKTRLKKVSLESPTGNCAAPMLSDILSSQQDPIVGNIGFIQERGFKLRAVANPLRMLQLALSKLKNTLRELQRTSLPWDCTFDQGKGVRWAHRKMKQSHKLYAYDLSNASDTIPLEDQINLLKSLAPSNDVLFDGSVELLARVSRARWRITYPHEKPGYLSWTKGQPLGLGPSFGLFATAHGLRLDQLSRELDLNDAFVVLGDDVIVTEALHKSYSSFLKNNWGCEFSVDKTLTSETLTEFASKLIISNDRTHFAFKYPKSNRLFSYAQPMDLLKRFGKKALKLVPSGARPMVQFVASLPTANGGYGIKWSSPDILLADGYRYRNILTDNKREAVLDRVEPSIFRKRGARYDSVELRDKPKVEREQDLVVAYNHGEIHKSRDAGVRVAHFATQYPSKFDKVLNKEERNSNQDQSVTPTEGQWLILHANANVENEDFEELHDDIVETVKHLPLDYSTRVSEFDSDLEVRPRMSGLYSVYNKLLLYGKRQIEALRVWRHVRFLTLFRKMRRK